MASTLLQIRIDDSIKKEAQEIFQNLGLNMSSAIKLFLNRVIIEQGLPFRMNLDVPSKNAENNNEQESWDVIAYLNSLDSVTEISNNMEF